MTSGAAGDARPGAGGELLGVLVAGSLDELRAMLPAGLTRHEQGLIDPPGVLETWE